MIIGVLNPEKNYIGVLNPEKIWHQQLVHLPT